MKAKITIKQFAGIGDFVDCQLTIRADMHSMSIVIPFSKTENGLIEYLIPEPLVCFASKFNLIPQLHQVCQMACGQFGDEFGINLYRKFDIDNESKGIAK